MRSLAAVLTLVLPAAAVAQVPSREILAEDFDRSRQAVINYINAAPDSMMTFRPTNGVRSFAEQIDHLSLSAAFIVSSALTGQQPGADFLGDTTRTLHSKAALAEIVNKRLNHATALIRNATPEQMAPEVEIFKGLKRPRWSYVLIVLNHNGWHLAQTVPYLRLNGVTPPPYLPF